jgi:hypothetical protein
VTPPFGKCVWGCGRDNFNREHIVGQQIAKLLDLELPLTMHLGDFRRAGGEQIEVVLEDRVCVGCNGGWMHKLDDKMIAFMGDALSTSTPVRLNEFRQRILARWAVKVALLLEVYLHDEAIRVPILQAMGPFFVPEDNFPALRKDHGPPKRTRVWVGGLEVATQPFTSHSNVITISGTREPHRDPRPIGYYSVFSLGPVVFAVTGWEIGFDGAIPSEPNPTEVALGKMRAIWPADKKPVAWPPSSQVSVRDLANMTGVPPEWA